MTDPDPRRTDPRGRIVRDILLGFAGVYIVSVAILILGMDGGIAAAFGVAVLPALFAGPFIGALMTLQRYLAAEDPTKGDRHGN